MKNLCLLFVLFCSLISQGKPSDKQVVQAFVKEWLDSSGSKDCALKYLDIDSSYLKDEINGNFFFGWFAAYSLEMKKEMKASDKIQIISHENGRNDMIKEYRLQTDDYSGVFYLIIGNKIATAIIIKNKKVISYCPHLRFGRAEINIPWFVNEPFVQKENGYLKGMNLIGR